MGLFDELKKMTRPYEDDGDHIESGFKAAVNEDKPTPAPAPEQPPQVRNVFASKRETKPQQPAKSYGAVREMAALEPKSFEEAVGIADKLRDNYPIFLNLEKTDSTVAFRLIDFLSGAAYALGGRVKRVSAKTYIIAPAGMELRGNAVDEVESAQRYF